MIMTNPRGLIYGAPTASFSVEGLPYIVKDFLIQQRISLYSQGPRGCAERAARCARVRAVLVCSPPLGLEQSARAKRTSGRCARAATVRSVYFSADWALQLVIG